jgi:serine/threonine protein kinase
VDRDLYRRSKELFLSLCQRSEAERDVALLEACGPDTRLLEQVKKLLSADERTRFPWDGDALIGAAPRAVAEALAEDLRGSVSRLGEEAGPLPERIGSYTIIRRLGEGGMGVVYEAEQQRPRRTVAIKVLRRAILTPGLRRRFEREAEVLGQLRHPGIAGVVEGGTDADGTPFIAMERIEGIPLDLWLEREGLSIAERIDLIVRIADAVDHAHRKGIIHRDL